MVVDQGESSVAQLRRGAIEFCVLALLRDDDRYGFDLVRTLAADELITSEGTIYPLLARLAREGKVKSYIRESDVGPARRYYRLTSEGALALAGFVTPWKRFSVAVTTLMERVET
jgi:PadR family transcriptional regulator, regulatory protein PadR